MKSPKKLGIWMDHSNALLFNFDSVANNKKVIASDFSLKDKHETLQRSESEMHNKQNHKTTSYYNKIANEIKKFDEVLLFGPTDAKLELFHILKDDHKFSKIKIECKTTDKMSEKEQSKFVQNYFRRFEFAM